MPIRVRSITCDEVNKFLINTLKTPAGTWFNIASKARLIGVSTNWQKDMLVAKSEAGEIENFGIFLMCVPRLEF